MTRINQTLKNFALPLSILIGALSYFFMRTLPLSSESRTIILRSVEIIQPILIFTMLLLTFSKVSLKELRWQHWHGHLLLVQGLSFTFLVCLARFAENELLRIALETMLICMICPTATAAAVVTGKLNGNVISLSAYIILVNLLVAVLFPMLIPLISESEKAGFFAIFSEIIAKLFPLLVLPLVCAELIRRFVPSLHDWISSRSGWTFRIWLISLSLAIALSTRSIVVMNMSFAAGICIALTSFFCCALQFFIGRRIGLLQGDKIAAQQALGQKNTTLAIWMAYTFLNPIIAVAGGFYSIWHNLFNSWQLAKNKSAK